MNDEEYINHKNSIKYLNNNKFKISTKRTLDDPLNPDFIDINEVDISDIPNENTAKKTLSVAEKLLQVKESPIKNDLFNFPGAVEVAQKNADQLKQPNSDYQVVWDNVYKSMTPKEKLNFHSDQRRKKIQDDIDKFETDEYAKYKERVQKYEDKEYNNYNTRTSNYRKFKTNPLIVEKAKEISLEENFPKIDPKIFVKSEAEIQIERLKEQQERQKAEHSRLVNDTGIAGLFWYRGGPTTFK